MSPITTAGQDISGPADRLFNPHRILSLSITVATNELESLWKAPRTYVRAQVREGTNVWNEIGIHLKGGIGSGQPLTQKPSLSLNFSKFRKTSRFYGLKRIQLNNCAQDPTYLSEVVASRLFTDAGVPCARCTHARIQLNERDLGIYVLREGVDELFLHKHFKGLSGQLYQGSYGADLLDQLTQTSSGIPNTIPFNGIRTAVALRNNNDRFNEIGRWVDIEAFYKFMAVENIIDHFDGYSRSVNNYRIFVPSDTNHNGLVAASKVTFIPNGLDQTFTRSKGPVVGLVSGKVSGIILESVPAQKKYVETYRRILQKSISPDALIDGIGSLQADLASMLSSIDSNLAGQQNMHARRFMERIHTRLLHLSNYFQMEANSSVFPRSQRLLPDAWIAHEFLHESSLFRKSTVAGNTTLVVEMRWPQ
ncbi:MAG: CotH kinase family protein [Verrucomicrobiales bacterium]|nr:CotH kinase family protein [Verrucomicrobiales bacterium]